MSLMLKNEININKSVSRCTVGETTKKEKYFVPVYHFISLKYMYLPVLNKNWYISNQEFDR